VFYSRGTIPKKSEKGVLFLVAFALAQSRAMVGINQCHWSELGCAVHFGVAELESATVCSGYKARWRIQMSVCTNDM